MAEQVELDVSLASVKEELKQMQAELNKVGAASDQTFSAMMKEAQDVAKEQRKLNEEFAQAEHELKKVEGAATGFGAKVKGQIAGMQVFGKSIGEWGAQLGGFIGRVGGAVSGVGRLSGVFRVLGVAIKATGIGLLIGIVASLIGYFSKFQSGIDKVNQVMAGVSAVVNVLIERFLKLGSAIVNFFSGNFSAAADDLKASISGIGTELVNAATAAADLERQIQNLRDAARTAGVEAARLRVQLEAQQQIAEDTNQSFTRRLAAARNALEIEKKIADQRIDFALREKDISDKQFAQNKESLEARDKAAQAEISLQDAISEGNKTVYEGEKLIIDIQKEAADARKKQAEEAKKERDQLLKDLEKLRVETEDKGIDRDLAAVNKKYDDLIKIAFAGIKKINDIETKGQLTPELTAQRKEFAELSVKLEEQRQSALLDVLVEANSKQLEAEEEQQKAQEALRKKDLEAAKKHLEEAKKLRESEIDIAEANFDNYIALLKTNGSKKELIEEAQREFDNLVKAKRLESEIQFQEGMLALLDEGDTAAIEQIKNTIEKLKAQLAGLSIEPPQKDDKRGFFARLFNIDPEDEDDFNKAIDEAVKGIQTLTAARVDAAKAAVEASEREIEAAEDKVKAAEDALERELEIAELGFASNVTLKRKELEEAQRQETEARARRAKALEEQKRAQRAQVLLDSVLQGSSLATASANVFKGFSAIPIIGPALGAIAVATMIAAFIASKAKALQAIRAQARHGIQGRVGSKGIIEGPSHEDGGVPLEVEGGEFTYQDGKRIAVVNRKATDAHFGLLQAINDDDRNAMRRYLEQLTGGVSRNSDMSDNLPGPAGGSDKSTNNGDKTTHELLRENNRLQKKIIELEENKTEYVDFGDYILKRHKGREEKLYKKNR